MPEIDQPLLDVVEAMRSAPDAEARFARVFRATFDQLYDGQHTGRYAWDQLYKTEKTHFGTLLEINLRREFTDLISDGSVLDFSISGHEIDCKYSFRMGGWMLPPESFGRLLLVCNANDEKSEWAVGVVRAKPEYLRAGVNRDLKSGLNQEGRENIEWLFWGAELPPNVLLQVDDETRAAIFANRRSGQERVNQLFRLAQRRRVSRNVVATVAQQDDFMKRVRANGGARSALAREGIIIIGGDYENHRSVAVDLGVEVPVPGEFISVRIAMAEGDEPNTAILEGRLWRVAMEEDPHTEAPQLPPLRLWPE
jgi:hypothetical protein